jgi:hypothetical protein
MVAIQPIGRGTTSALNGSCGKTVLSRCCGSKKSICGSFAEPQGYPIGVISS